MFKDTSIGQTHFYCPHGRVDAQDCPHCAGINSIPVQTYQDTIREEFENRYLDKNSISGVNQYFGNSLNLVKDARAFISSALKGQEETTRKSVAEEIEKEIGGDEDLSHVGKIISHHDFTLIGKNQERARIRDIIKKYK